MRVRRESSLLGLSRAAKCGTAGCTFISVGSDKGYIALGDIAAFEALKHVRE